MFRVITIKPLTFKTGNPFWEHNYTNIADLTQVLQNAESDQGLHCLL